MNQDRKFFDTFMLILGVLMGFSVVIYFIAQEIDATLAGQALTTDVAQELLVERLDSIGQVQVAGDAGSVAPVPTPQPEAAAEPAAADKPISGKAVYATACIACHGAGVAGAPKIGDTAAWAPRIAKGMDVLKDHALHGFNGETGIMPAKGGFMNLSDQEV
ncbi:MAG TPA: c-type cytochrome, partial [Gammaproteobacteria bacterium]|nr:c-type cytochrome [Gammaproteobacteria bacterium]